MPATLTATDFQAALTETLSDLKGVEHEAVLAVANEYAPRLAALAASDDPAGERDDILTNMKLRLADLGVQAETAASQTVGKVVEAALNVALKFALV